VASSHQNVECISRTRIAANRELRERVETVLNSRQQGAATENDAQDNERVTRARVNPPNQPVVWAELPANLAANNEDVSSDEDALDDPKENEITADYLEALSRRRLPNPEDIIWTDLDQKGRRVVTFEQKRARRMGIYYLFTQVYQSVPKASKPWRGQNGIAVRTHEKGHTKRAL
jgi:hypothetical protein